MDANTKEVLDGIIRIAEIVVTALMVVYVARNNNKMNAVKNTVSAVDTKVDAVKTHVEVVTTKVDEYRKEINGHMTALLEKTEELATAKEKARGIEEAKEEPKK